jgi:preprotein translocase subunit SecE
MSEHENKDQVNTLGLARWVQATFMACGLLLFWVFDKAANIALAYVTEPNELIVTAGSALVAVLVTLSIYRNATVQVLSNDVAAELSKVTWPSRQETTTSTFVVIIASLIAAAIVGAFDAIWSALTDLIYKV